MKSNGIRTARAAVFFLLGLYGFAGYCSPGLFQFLDGVNLLFHEAGHLFYAPFGQEASVWGGTLLQLQIPFGIAAAFLWKRQTVSAAVMAWWGGENLSMISLYIKDARVQVLPFVGGETHDWGWILHRHGVLRYDQEIGSAVWMFGLLVVLTAAAWGIWGSLKAPAESAA